MIGSREIVLAFKLIGINGTTAENREEVLAAFNKATGNLKVANVSSEALPRVLILTEEAASLIESEEIEWQKTGKFPLIVEVPGLNGRIENKKTLSESIREAIGVQI